MTNKESSELERLVQQLERQRDELYLKLHLGKAEARNEWEKLERQWEQLRNKLSQSRQVVSESSEDMAAAAQLLGEEIRKGYERLRRLF